MKEIKLRLRRLDSILINGLDWRSYWRLKNELDAKFGDELNYDLYDSLTDILKYNILINEIKTDIV